MKYKIKSKHQGKPLYNCVNFVIGVISHKMIFQVHNYFKNNIRVAIIEWTPRRMYSFNINMYKYDSEIIFCCWTRSHLKSICICSNHSKLCFLVKWYAFYKYVVWTFHIFLKHNCSSTACIWNLHNAHFDGNTYVTHISVMFSTSVYK